MTINRMGQDYIPTKDDTAMKMNKSHMVWPKLKTLRWSTPIE
jgi:hypothetical protein